MKKIFNNLEEFNYITAIDEPIVLCLGFFDCLHLGHQKLIRKARTIAFKQSAKLALFTFSNNPFKYFGDRKEILTYEERCYILPQLYVDYVIRAEFSLLFSNLSKEEFLDKLILNKNIKAVVVGDDYTFGNSREGNVEYLKEYCSIHDITVYVEPMYLYNNKKLSSRYISSLIEDGEVQKVNSLITNPYIIMGTVQKGRGIGHTDLVPTANIEIPEDKEKLKPGVYYTNVIINGIRYRAATSVGNNPTYGLNKCTVESYILFYNKQLYGQQIIVEFIERIRDMYKFECKDKLLEQINKDIKYICSQNGGNDDY